MITLLFIYVMWFAIAGYQAQEEVAFTWPFRNLGDDNFPPDVKARMSKIAHRQGAASVIVMALSLSLLYGSLIAWLFQNWLFFFAGIAISFTAGLTMYWLVFDIRYARGIGQPWDYLGDTAATDNWLRSLGPRAGRNKAYLCGYALAGFLALAWRLYGL